MVAIVGRPNVGKSTLFNRIVGYRKAIVEDTPGVTRDLNFAEVGMEGKAFTLVDTGGFEPGEEPVAAQVIKGCQWAMEEADLVLFVLDGREGLTPLDEEIGRLLREKGKRVLYVINKIDGPRHEKEVYDFYRLGSERLHPVSAQHGYRFGELMEELLRALPSSSEEEEKGEEGVRVAVVGRPNVGKSSLVNAILGYERVIVDERPGTTRDAIDTPFRWGERSYLLIDTAGIRRRSRISLRLERYSVIEAIRSIERSDVSLLMIDAQEGVTEQDMRIGGLIERRGKGCVILVNKWDLLGGKAREGEYAQMVCRRLWFLDHAPLLFISALRGEGMGKVLEAVDRVAEEGRKRINTSELNRWMEGVLSSHSPPHWRGRPVKFYYLTQVGVRPPTFVFFVNHPQGVTANYQRYLARKLREAFRFEGNPIRLIFRQRG